MRTRNTAVSLDVPGRILEGSTLVPARFVSESLGAKTVWVAEANRVEITSGLETPAPEAGQILPERPTDIPDSGQPEHTAESYVLTQPVVNAVDNLNRTSGKVTWRERTEYGVWADSSYTYCARFVRMCYGEFAARFGTAIDMYEHFKELNLIRSGLNPPRAAVVFYDRHAENGNYGHVGISDGEGRSYSVINRSEGVLLKNITGALKAGYLGYVTAEDFKAHHLSVSTQPGLMPDGDWMTGQELAQKYKLGNISVSGRDDTLVLQISGFPAIEFTRVDRANQVFEAVYQGVTLRIILRDGRALIDRRGLQEIGWLEDAEPVSEPDPVPDGD